MCGRGCSRGGGVGSAGRVALVCAALAMGRCVAAAAAGGAPPPAYTAIAVEFAPVVSLVPLNATAANALMIENWVRLEVRCCAAAACVPDSADVFGTRADSYPSAPGADCCSRRLWCCCQWIESAWC